MDTWQTFRTYRDTWLRIGLDCRPADRARAEAAITALYRSSRETAPDFVWAASPAEMLRRIPPPEKPTAWVSLLYDHIRVKTQREPDGGHGELLDLLWAEIRYAQQRVGLVPSPIIGGLRAAAQAVCRNPLPNTLRYALYHYLTLPLQRIVWEGIAQLVFRALKEKDEPAVALPSLLYGQHDVPHLVAYQYRLDVLGVRCRAEDEERLRLWSEVAQSCLWWWPGRTVCVLCERPEQVAFEPGGREEYRLHCEDGPAVRFRDGWGCYAVHGVPVQERCVLYPETITGQDLLNERNVRIRDYLLARFGGMERFFLEATDPVQEDPCGALYRWQWPRSLEAVAMVRVINATPEPDGSRQRFWLHVPPWIRTAREGVAWTFGMQSGEYHPEVET